MERRIVYLMSGPAHLPYLVVSLKTLREHWEGKVVVYAFPQSFDLALTISRDGDLDIEAKPWSPLDCVRPTNRQFFNKINLMQCQDEGSNLYLDADTTIHGDLSYLFRVAEDCGFCATQWNQWVTTGPTVGKRIARLRSFPEINQSIVESTLSKEWPSVNGGVFSCQSHSPVLASWLRWTKIADRIFIPDETVLHTMMPWYVPKEQMDVAMSGRFNCSPLYKPKDLDVDDVIVFHYHGDCNCRPKKSKRGCNMWMPMFHECLESNVGRMGDWIGKIKNRHLNKVMR